MREYSYVKELGQRVFTWYSRKTEALYEKLQGNSARVSKMADSAADDDNRSQKRSHADFTEQDGGMSTLNTRELLGP